MDSKDVVEKLKTTGDYASTIWRIVRAFGLIILGVLMIVAMTRVDNQYADMNEVTTAQIVSVEKHQINFEYEYEGKEYSFKTIVKDEADFEVGDEIEIQFSENDPSVAVPTGKDHFNVLNFLSKILMVVGGICIIIGVIKIIPPIKYYVSKLSEEHGE